MDEEGPVELQGASGPMMAVNKDMALNHLAVLRVKNVADDPGNRRINMRDVIAIDAARIDGKSNVVLVKLDWRPAVGNDLAGQVDVEDESLPHVQESFAAAFATDGAAGFGDTRGHNNDSQARSVAEAF